jgi:uncharacterized membrane protein YeiB
MNGILLINVADCREEDNRTQVIGGLSAADIWTVASTLMLSQTRFFVIHSSTIHGIGCIFGPPLSL